MALAAIEAPSPIFFASPSSAKLHHFTKSFSPTRFRISLSVPAAPLNFVSYTLSPALQNTRKSGFHLHSSVETTVSVEEKVEKQPNPDNRRKLFVQNLPWSFSVVDIKKVFGECGVVDDVEIIKRKDGKSRGFAFVTMSTGEEAQAAIEKFDSSELVGRTITVEFAKRFKRPVSAPPADTPVPRGQNSHKLYVSNLQWKARSNDLREFFSSAFNPISARVVFENPSGKSAGFGFVAFATKEEAESAISALDGKELMGRPVRLKLSERNSVSSGNEEEGSSEQDIDASVSKEEESSKQQTTEAS